MTRLQQKARSLFCWELVSIVAVTCLLYGQPGAHTVGPVSFALEKSSLTLHEPVLVRLQITNPTSRAIDVNLGRNSKENIIVTIVTPKGKAIGYAPPSRREGIWFPGKVHLEPGESYHQTVVLNEWFRFDELGTYNVQIHLASPVQSGTNVLPTSWFTASLEIRNRDPERLETRCQDLVARIGMAQSYKESAEGASALSYVDDPIAIPYLEQVLRNRMVVEIAVEGLKRINTPESVQALIRALKMPDEDTVSQARSALRLIQSKTSDPETQALIKEALRR